MLEIKNKKQIFEAISAIANQNLLTIEEFKKILETAIFKSFHSKFDPDANLEFIIDEKTETFSLINKSKLVVLDEEFEETNRPFEIPLSEAKKIKSDTKIYDHIAEEVDFSAYSKSVAAQIRAMLTQTVKERRKVAVWEKHQSLKGEMVDVTILTITPAYVMLVLNDGTTAYMPAKLRNMKIPLKVGQKTKVYVEDVLKESKDAQIIVSNGSKVMVKRVLELEVPEISQGIIEIVNISRIPGERSKVAVKALNENVDPVGAIIGSEGSRINSIISKLEGEKLDVIVYSEDINKFIANAFSPARIVSVIDKTYAEGPNAGEIIPGHKIVIAPDKHQTLAIGKNGSNAKLAVELVNSRVDVISYSDAVARGIDIVFNGNLTQDELAILESGEKLVKNKDNKFTNKFSNNTRTSQFASSTRFAPRTNFDFDADIASFNVSMEDEVRSEKGFVASESIFSEEELKQMEAQFEFDDELLDISQEDTSEFSPEFDEE